MQLLVAAMSHEERDKHSPSPDTDRNQELKKLKWGGGADFCLPGEYPNTILFLHTSNKHKMELQGGSIYNTATVISLLDHLEIT